MGWLFAVALGLHRQRRSDVFVALPPIALGHALSVAIFALAFAWVGYLADPARVRAGAGVLLMAWALYHWRYGHRHRVRFGMQIGLAGLVAWSFLMATAHGAGLMLWPALMPLCSPGTGASGRGVTFIALLGVGLHTLAMLAVTGLVAGAVYEWVGLEILKRAWINLDLLWAVVLLATGLLLFLL
jgi:hypothetical protein